MGDGERQPQKENGGNEWRRVGQRHAWACVCVCERLRKCMCMCMRARESVCVDCHLPLFGGCRWQWCWGVGGVGRRVDKGDSTLKPTKLQKQWILNSRLNSRAYMKHYCIIILDLSPMGRRFELEQQGPVRTIFAPCDNCPAGNWKSYRELLPSLLLGGIFFFLCLNRTNANKRVLFVLASVIRDDSKNRNIQQLEANMIVFTLEDSRQAAV